MSPEAIEFVITPVRSLPAPHQAFLALDRVHFDIPSGSTPVTPGKMLHSRGAAIILFQTALVSDV